MRLTRVRAWNFKSFRELDIRLDGLNVVIGANASGKSNFVQLFKFIHDIVESGLENAISIQGGARYLRHMSCGADDRLTIELSSETGPGDPNFLPVGESPPVTQSTYRFTLAFPLARNVSIEEDEFRADLRGKESPFRIKRTKNRYGIEGDPDVMGNFVLTALNSGLVNAGQPALLIENETARLMLSLKGLESIATYDIDPKGPKHGAVLSGKSDLEPDAGNLAIALDRILSDDEGRRTLLNLLQAVLPFAEGLQTQRLGDSSVFFDMREKFSREAVPATFLSDGTVDLIAMLAILYFERKSLVVIEEPERNLHPSLISSLVELLKDAASIKQIIVSTHNPEVVRYADPKQLILISRDGTGSSHASRPADKEEVKRFLAGELSMHELYIDNLLEV
ncbi:MAG TPA: AAA family ATPase [Bryobacteraceae bacterium]|nr:AAA family ATPase [Bryobacteraceae bacterium]